MLYNIFCPVFKDFIYSDDNIVKREDFVYAQRKVTFAVYVKKTTIYAIFHFKNKIHATIMLTKNNSSMGFIFLLLRSQ